MLIYTSFNCFSVNIKMIIKLVKILIIVLLILVSLNFIFTTPGNNILQVFDGVIKEQIVLSRTDFLFRYPPGVFYINKLLVHLFPLSNEISLLYYQTAWTVSKYIIFSFYIFAWLSLLLFTKTVNTGKKATVLDTSLYFFLSVSILLSSVSLGLYEIMSVSGFILAILFLFKKNFPFSLLFYQISILFNLPLIILSPLFFIFYYKKQKKIPQILLVKIFSFIIGNFVVVYLFTSNLPFKFLSLSKSFTFATQTFGLPWLIKLPIKYILDYPYQSLSKANLPPFLLAIFITALAVEVFGVFFFKFVVKNHFKKLSHFLCLFLVGNILILCLTIFFPEILYLYLLLIFLTVIYTTYSQTVKSKHLSIKDFLSRSFVVYLTTLVFFPGIPEGNLIFLVILSLLVFLSIKTEETSFQLLLVNILVFTGLFVHFGNAGINPIVGDYFTFFTSLIGLLFLIYSLKYINHEASLQFSKKFLISFMIILNLAFIPSQGTSDIVSWTQYAIATIQEKNPFIAQTLVDQRYPPLSTVIISFFSNLWEKQIGFRPSPLGPTEVSQDYALSVKISIFVMYIATIFAYLLFVKSKGKINALIASFTTIALVVQTQGLADLNIHVLPSLLVSFLFFFRRRYFLSGLLYGLTISIKWQPVILIPLFFASILDPWTNIGSVVKYFVVFTSGLLIIPLVSWWLVYIQPGGTEAIQRSFDYLINGAPMLSGQALNLNWIVTYLIHIFAPYKDVSLSHLEGLNRQIPTGVAPFIFQGPLFLIFGFLVTFRYWLSQKKDSIKFTSTALMIFFTHHILNKSAYEKHLFYSVSLMLLLYLIKPNTKNRLLLILFDIMTVMNLILFYGFTGPKHVNRLFLGFDLTIAYSALYVFIYFIIFWRYIKKGYLLS